MPRRRLNERNLATHDILTGDFKSPRPPASVIAQPDTSSLRPGGSHLTANDRIRQNAFERNQKRRPEPQELSFENLARHDAAMTRSAENLSGYTAVFDKPVSAQVTPVNLSGSSSRTASDVAHDGSGEGQGQHLPPGNVSPRGPDPREYQKSGSLRDRYDYTNIGWQPSRRPDGWYGPWEPRSGRRW